MIKALYNEVIVNIRLSIGKNRDTDRFSLGKEEEDPVCWIASANILHLEKRTTQYHDTCNVVPRTGTQKSEHGAVIHAPRVHPPHSTYFIC